MPDATRSRVRDRLVEGLRRLGRQTRPSGTTRAESAIEEPTGDRTGEAVDARTQTRSRRIEEVRRLLEAGRVQRALVCAAELKADPEQALTGAACAGLVALHRGYDALAHHELACLPVSVWSRHVAAPYVRAGLLVDPESTLREVRRLVAQDPAWIRPRQWLGMAEHVFGAGDQALARDLLSRADAALARLQPPPRTTLKHAWMHRWVERSETSPSAPATRAVRFAVLDYDHPQPARSSANIGDHVQTIASLGHLLRHRNVSFDGPEDLRDLLERLQARVRREQVLDGDPTTVQVLTADRDATRYNAIPEDTWTLAFGWYMHELFGTRFGFPFHHHLRPLFVSFHCNKREMLSPDAVGYLREHGPIGCRDWTTVDILLSLDVPAFFSGCLTSTIDTVFEELTTPPPSDAPVAYVDVPPSQRPTDAVTYRHSGEGVRARTFVQNVDEALQRLETYRREHSAVVTSRLHCYLPMRALGVPVEFVPENLSDIRFAGLAGITDERLAAMRRGIADKLEQVLDLVLTGAAPDQVYARWRELTADEVAQARRRHEAPAVLEDVPADLATTLAGAVAATRTVAASASVGEGAEPVHVAVSLSEVDEPLRVTLSSLCRRTDRDVHVWLLRRSRQPLDLDDVRDLAVACGATVSEVPVREVAELLRDRCETREHRVWEEELFLPRLLPDVRRVLVVPRHALVRGDVGGLADLDLGGLPFAAPDTPGSRSGSGFAVVHRAARRLGERTDLSTELRRQAHGAHVFDFSAFDTGVLVLDLELLRGSDFVERAARLVATFGLTAHEALHVLAGPHRAVVPQQWHAAPTRQHVDDPALLVWPDRLKPWTDGPAPWQAAWHDEREEAA